MKTRKPPVSKRTPLFLSNFFMIPLFPQILKTRSPLILGGRHYVLVFLCKHLSISFYRSIYLSVYLSVCLSVCLSVYLSNISKDIFSDVKLTNIIKIKPNQIVQFMFPNISKDFLPGSASTCALCSKFLKINYLIF